MSADTAGRLTDAERVMLADASEHTTDAACWNITCAGSLPWVVARIKADAITAERERIARAIEGERPEMGMHINITEYRRGLDDALLKASRMARADHLGESA